MAVRQVGYTGDDLITIGRIVNKITRRLKAFDLDSGSDVEDYVDNLSVDVLLEGEHVGVVKYDNFGGFLSFFPHDIEEENK